MKSKVPALIALVILTLFCGITKGAVNFPAPALARFHKVPYHETMVWVNGNSVPQTSNINKIIDAQLERGGIHQITKNSGSSGVVRVSIYFSKQQAPGTSVAFYTQVYVTQSVKDDKGHSYIAVTWRSGNHIQVSNKQNYQKAILADIGFRIHNLLTAIRNAKD